MVARGVRAAKVTTVYTGIWSGELQPVARDLRGEHGVAPGTLLLGVAGNLRRVKGFDRLLDALALLKGRGVPFRVLVAGGGYEGVLGEVRARGLDGHVTFLGQLPDVLAFTPNVDCLVVPSRIDALPRVAIEATVLGTPVVATRVGGIPEILDEGRGGVLVEPDDAHAFAGALESVARDPGAARALAAHALARNRVLFSLDRCVARHLEIYGA
jgi:glycosyltransferase involved in cell wall biosynthesis